MALKSKEWFYKECLKQIKDYGPFAHLCWDIVDKGIGQKDKTRGHVTQAIGACQEFIRAYPRHKKTIREADPTRPFEIRDHQKVLKDFKPWLNSKDGPYGHKNYGYNYDTLKGYLTTGMGGTLTGGGGGNDELKRVLRLMAEFL